MHIPDGFLDPKFSAGMGLAAAGVLGYCVAKVRAMVMVPVVQTALATASDQVKSIAGASKRALSSFGERLFLKMGLVGSLIFAAQMFNFPISQGTSGHLLGGILAAIMVGPFAGTIVIAVILTIQAIFFADGGIIALGANIFNMGIIGTLGCYYIYYAIKSLIKNKQGIYLGVFIAAFFSVLLAAIATAFELALSKTIPLNLVLPAMAKVHVIIGVAEGLITVGLLSLLIKINPLMLESENE